MSAPGNIVSDAKYFIVRKGQPKFPSCMYLMLSRSMEALLLGKGLLRKVCLQMFDIVLLLLAGFFKKSFFHLHCTGIVFFKLNTEPIFL